MFRISWNIRRCVRGGLIRNALLSSAPAKFLRQSQGLKSCNLPDYNRTYNFKYKRSVYTHTHTHTNIFVPMTHIPSLSLPTHTLPSIHQHFIPSQPLPKLHPILPICPTVSLPNIHTHTHTHTQVPCPKHFSLAHPWDTSHSWSFSLQAPASYIAVHS